jgi:prepilin-type N-terminal cleavage/methylation domain-containing protein
MSATFSRRISEGGRRNLIGRPTPDSRSLTPGFTLVEMLVVITIIGILVSLASVAVFKALETAKKARIKMEITNLESAIEAFKQKYGDYPPSCLDPVYNKDGVRRFLAKAFPRCNPDTEALCIPTVSDDQALVFWLTSISKDPAHPLSAATADRQSLFDFDKTRLKATVSYVMSSSGPPLQTPLGNNVQAGWRVDPSNAFGSLIYTSSQYIPVSGKDSPYHYFEAREYIFHAAGPTGGPTPNQPVPYLLEPWDNATPGLQALSSGTPDVRLGSTPSNSVNATSMADFQKLCANPKSFQIISAGLDGDYGTVDVTTAVPQPVNFVNQTGSGTRPKLLYYKSYPSGIGYDKSGADDDNITNFCEKNGLGDAKP